MKLQWSVSVFPFLPTWYFNVSCTLTPLWYLYTRNSRKLKLKYLKIEKLWTVNIRKSKSNYHFLVQEMSPSRKMPSALIFSYLQYQYKASYWKSHLLSIDQSFIWPMITITININFSPCDHGRGVCHYGTVENKCVTIILLENNDNGNDDNSNVSVQGISMMYDHRDFMGWTRKGFVLVNDFDRCKCDRRCDWWCDYRWEISLRTKLCKQRVEILFCLEKWLLWG